MARTKAKLPKKLHPEDQAEDLLNEIEGRFPPSLCSLVEYRQILRELVDQARDRINLLDDEIGDYGE